MPPLPKIKHLYTLTSCKNDHQILVEEFQHFMTTRAHCWLVLALNVVTYGLIISLAVRILHWQLQCAFTAPYRYN